MTEKDEEEMTFDEKHGDPGTRLVTGDPDRAKEKGMVRFYLRPFM